jgi:hypothetical protein
LAHVAVPVLYGYILIYSIHVAVTVLYGYVLIYSIHVAVPVLYGYIPINTCKSPVLASTATF